MARSSVMPPLRLILAYALDWLLIIAMAAVGGGLSYATPYHRPFSLLDLTISFPYVATDLISTVTLIVVSLIAPAIIIVLVVAVFTPVPAAKKHMGTATFWKAKLWEWNAGWLGLALSWVLAFLITQGLKNVVGKPRPDAISRCQPDLTNIAAHVVSGFGQSLSERWVLVSTDICTQQDKSILSDGFRSFLSGHSSSSWSGLLYLSLWLAVKFNITIPYVQPTSPDHTRQAKETRDDVELLPLHSGKRQYSESSAESTIFSNYRRQGAGPPVFGHIIILIPIATAIYICTTRFVDFKHQGVDILSGSILGIITALVGFRCYHSSLSGPHAFTWGPRHTDQAFAVPTGARGWTGTNMQQRAAGKASTDLPAASQRTNSTVPM